MARPKKVPAKAKAKSVPGDAPVKRKTGPRPKDSEYLRAKGAYDKNPDRDPARNEPRPADETLAIARDYAAIARRYAEDVLGGRIPACKLTKLACARHLRDLERQRAEGFPYYFDTEEANRFCARIETYPHIKGRWASRKEKIKLEPWQCFATAVPFGWMHSTGRRAGKRRFRELYLRVARKNAKSTLAAAIGLNLMFADGEFGAEVLSGATTEKQAWEVFGPARLMMERSPKLCNEFGVEVWSKALIRPEDNSRFLPMIGNPGDGASPNCAIIDEFHEHATPDQYDTMKTGMGAREQPIIVIITTAGTDLAGPCKEKDDEAVEVLEGKKVNEELFALIYGIDEGDDWSDPKVLDKANPNIDISVSREYLESQQRDAIRQPAQQNTFKTKHLDIWCGASTAAFNSEDIKRAADPSLRRENFRGKPGVKALDLASKTDICAEIDIFPYMSGGQRHYAAFGKYYLPEETIESNKANQQAYRKWVLTGHLIKTEGAEIDFNTIRESVKADKSFYSMEQVRYDPWRATQLAHELMKDGAKTVEMPQSGQAMAQAFDELLAALKSGRFHFDGHPVLEWMFGNTVARKGPKGVMLPGRDKDERKIDGVVAICMALSAAMTISVDDAAQMMGWLRNPQTV